MAKPSKKQNERGHAKRRFQERYGICLNRSLRKQIIDQIKQNKAFLLRKSSNRISIYLVIVENQSIPIVFDHKRTELVTALPRRDV